MKTPTEAPTFTTTAAAKAPPAVDDDVESKEDVDKQPEVIKTEPVPVDDQDPADIRGNQDPADVRGNAQGSGNDPDSPGKSCGWIGSHLGLTGASVSL